MNMVKRFPVAVLGVALMLSGCVSATVGESVKDKPSEEAAAQTAPPAQAETAAKPGYVPRVEIMAPDGAAKPQVPAEPPRLSTEEMQKRRELEAALRSAFDSFWDLIKQKNVDTAMDLVVAEQKDQLRGEFYRFTPKYNISRSDITELVPNFGTASDAEVSGFVMMYEKGSVAPMKKEVFQRWRIIDGKWTLTSQRFK